MGKGLPRGSHSYVTLRISSRRRGQATAGIKVAKEKGATRRRKEVWPEKELEVVALALDYVSEVDTKPGLPAPLRLAPSRLKSVGECIDRATKGVMVLDFW